MLRSDAKLNEVLRNGPRLAIVRVCDEMTFFTSFGRLLWSFFVRMEV